MPLPRTALYGLGENLHIAVWPGDDSLTKDITRFIAREGRSFVVSVGALLRKSDIHDGIPHHEHLRETAPDIFSNGGSCIAAPNGEWVIPPIVNEEGLFTATIAHTEVLRERQNFDSVGHYSRPDVPRLHVNRQRQSVVEYED